MDDLSSLPASLAKLSPPQTAGLIPRPRLFQRLDRACARGAAWVYGPSGAGKTSLLATWIEADGRVTLWYRADEDDSDPATLAHYLDRLARAHAPGAPSLPALTPEYLGGLDAFARRFWRELYARLSAPCVLVVDDCHQIGRDSPAQRLLCVALAEVPPGSALVLCGRTAPPPAFARFALHEGALTGADLRLDAHEALALMDHIDPGGGRDVEALREITRGWIVGFTLLASRPGELPSVGRHLAPDAEDALFAYFAQEVLTRCAAAERAFLVAIAPLATFTLSQARKLTGREDAEEVLETLRCGQYFITRLSARPTAYRCHPLFHEFLRHEARRILPAQEWRRLRLEAAALAETEGDHETAAALCIDAEAWADLTGLLCRVAPALVAQGRHALLEAWIGQVPADLLSASPWLCYWLGTAQVYAGQTLNGREHLGRAYRGFESACDRDGLLLAWGGIVESYSFEWDDCSAVSAWASRIQGALPEDLLVLPAPVVARLLGAGMALQVVDRGHPVSLRLAALAKCVLGRPGLEAAQGPAMTLLLIDRLYGGDFVEAQVLLDLVMGAPDFAHWPPIARMLFGQFRAACAWQTGNPQLTYELVERVLRDADETGIHGSDFVTTTQGVYAALSVRDGARALQYLARLQPLLRPDRRGDAAHLGALTGCHRLLAGDLPGARREIERAAETVETLGMGFAALVARAMLAWVLLLLGELASARDLIGETLSRTRAAGTASIEFESRVAHAYAELIGGERQDAREALREAFALGRQRHYFVTGPVWLPEAMALLCAEALEAGIEPDYARELIARRALLPPSPEAEHWPWPVRIHSLGRFGVFVGGEPLGFQRKGQGKPIQLLQALLALGGRDVAVATLQDLLWPDAEGDDAGNAFHVTLLRLRRLLGESALRLCDHRVSLDDRSCWVDAWAFQRLVTRFETGLASGAAPCPAPRILSEKALGLYRGPFLAGEDAPWATAARARLRSRFLRLQVGCARQLRGAGDCEEAAGLCRRVLEIEPIAEEILIELLRALLAGGLSAQATAALRESELLFQRLLGRPPSPALWRLIDS
jgi:ATP/maltotriose-dependent transcriptional regulator MalT/DNA-binding SARP family transcriptional activator